MNKHADEKLLGPQGDQSSSGGGEVSGKIEVVPDDRALNFGNKTSELLRNRLNRKTSSKGSFPCESSRVLWSCGYIQMLLQVFGNECIKNSHGQYSSS